MKRRALPFLIGMTLAFSTVFAACGNATDVGTSAQEESASSQEAVQEEVQESDFQVSEKEDGTVAITGYDGRATRFAIPETIDGKTVTEIGDAAFFNATRIESISLPDTVTRIGDGAFANCASLESFDMPDSVTELGGYAFARDICLFQVRLSNSLTEVPVQTFYKCTALAAIEIPEGVTSLGEAAFADCQLLTSISLPESLEVIGDGAFSGVFYMESELVIPVKTLTEGALSNLSATNVSFPNLETIESGALRQASIDTFVIPASVNHIAEDALAALTTYEIQVEEANENYCSVDGVLYTKDKQTLIRYPKFKNPEDGIITFAEEVTKIGDYAFAGVIRMELDMETPFVCTVPETVTEIGKGAFQFCDFEEITLPDSVTVIPEDAFQSLSGLKTVTLGQGITEIQANAFRYVTSLENITIPASVTSIDPTAFSEAYLSAFSVADGNANYSDKDGILYDKAGQKLIVYPAGKLDEECQAEVPEGTTTIGAYAFEANRTLRQVTLPESLTTIEDYAFCGTESLECLEIPESVTSIGEEAVGYAGGTTLAGDLYAHNFYIVGQQGSEAATYAADNGIAFFTANPATVAEEITMKTGETIQLDQTGLVEGSAVYTSSDESICYLDDKEQGYVTAVSAGQATIYRSVGYSYKAFTITVEGETVEDDHITNVERVGADYGFDVSEYAEIGPDAIDGYLATVEVNNQSISTDKKDNYCINCYTSNEYIPLFAVQGDTVSEERIQGNPSYRNLDLYRLISDQLQKELAQFTNTEKVVLYSGIPAAIEVTKTGNTVADMKASIGQVYESTTNVSTSLYHSVSFGYIGTGSGQAMLEIYAPPELITGSFISALSEFPDEMEVLLKEGSRFVVLDAGVRPFVTEGEEGAGMSMERYFKLLMIE